MSSTRRGGVKLDQDKYYTPRWCIELLIERIDFTRVNTFLEPCKGDGRILDFIPKTVTTSWYEIDNDEDYFKSPLEQYVDLIVTNPPFSLSIPFYLPLIESINSIFHIKFTTFNFRVISNLID